jgi:hypothetical protein
MPAVGEVTRNQEQIHKGDPYAADQLGPPVYGKLPRLAAHKWAQDRRGHTPWASSLDHQADRRLVVNHGA